MLARARSVNTQKPAALKCAPGARNKYESIVLSALPPADSAEIYGSVKDPYFHGSVPAGMPMRPYITLAGGNSGDGAQTPWQKQPCLFHAVSRHVLKLSPGSSRAV